MIRAWITFMQGGRKIERPVHTNKRGHSYVRVHGTKLFVDRLASDGRVVERYHMGQEANNN